ncbi:TPA: hypothetical protein DIV48_02560 [Candidatus Kaiserbacteria bacterium]|nr:MAG: hypothetical protein UY93_C0002G0158 [Parcubacteria group bacterium GW2011_GWA1_56_13]KKW46789.1 MAG: hypothetical protein UY97_C0003G0063 [Parcubacteria group bacterium GW2011_GWB1_57_6]HCR52509.1 hypothetical protein [Candidatus Kaiserbacteria bacterium]
MSVTAASISSKEKVARRVHYMTTSGAAFEPLGKAHTHELYGLAVAGVMLALNVPREKAEEMLLAAVK